MRVKSPCAPDVELPANAGDKRSAQVDYTLIKTLTGWRVYNVSIEGASLVTIYRNNFNDILRQGGPDALIQSLKTKRRLVRWQACQQLTMA